MGTSDAILKDFAGVQGELLRGVGPENGLLQPITLPFSLPTPVYGAMLAIWHMRPALQSNFPLHKGRPLDFVRFLAWCAADGRHQYAALRSIPDWDAALARPVTLPRLSKDRWSGGFSLAMFFYGVARYRYFLHPLLKDRVARHRMARAFWRGERHKRMLPAPEGWQLEWLHENLGPLEPLIDILRIESQDGGMATTELTGKFGLEDYQRYCTEYSDRRGSEDNGCSSNMDGGMGFVDGAGMGDGTVELPLPKSRWLPHFRLPIKVYRELAWLRKQFNRQPSQFALSGITQRITRDKPPVTASSYPFGVNLYGYANGELGIGEDVRLVAQALDAQGIPFCIVNVKPGDNVSQQETSADRWLVDEPRYAINIFCTTGIEQVRFGIEQGFGFWDGRYTIGFWPWELPRWPASCEHAYATVDEIWGISEYTARAYRNAQRPVIPMSLPVTVDKVAALGRSDFGLPEDAFLYVFSFDFNSTLVRKNPKAVLEAFQRAFPIGSKESVGLVIKASHIDARNRAWRRICKLVEQDGRIKVIAETLRRPEVLALYRCCDCFVSLHRAEGFGRGLAEALLLDRQVVATAFSGNLDFCSEDRVGLVRSRPVAVGEWEYFHGDGQRWADPDIEHAAEVMRDLYKNPKLIKPGAVDFSPSTLGRRYALRLDELRRELQL